VTALKWSAKIPVFYRGSETLLSPKYFLLSKKVEKQYSYFQNVLIRNILK
jgi:hypothetical protein